MLISLAGAAAYVAVYKTTGPQMDPLAGGAILLFLPVALLVFGAIVWTPAWAILNWKFGGVPKRRAAIASAMLALLTTIIYCGGGVACFLPGRHEHLVGWFFVICAALGAAAHAAIYQRMTRTEGEA